MLQSPSLSSGKALAYAATGFSAALLHNIFITYYVHLFMTVYQLDNGWFLVGEVIFMVWNSLNDPLFGWLMDTSTLSKRLSAIRWGGALWAFGFLFIFFPWSLGGGESQADYETLMPRPPQEEEGGALEAEEEAEGEWFGTTTGGGSGGWLGGLHFTFCLCLYDACLSYVMLAHAALLADITISSDERAKVNMWNSALSVVGSAGVFLCHLFWDTRQLTGAFRFFVVTLSLVALAGFQCTAHFLAPPKYVSLARKVDIYTEDDDDRYGRHLLKRKEQKLSSPSSPISSSKVTTTPMTLLREPQMVVNVKSRKTEGVKALSQQDEGKNVVLEREAATKDDVEQSLFGGEASDEYIADVDDMSDEGENVSVGAGESKPDVMKFARQLMQQTNFWLFIFISLVQVFNCHFNSNFFSIFLDSFLQDRLPQLWVQALFLMSASSLPHFVVVVLAPYVRKYSLYAVIRFLFWVKLVLAAVAFLLAGGNGLFIVLFIVCNKVFSEAICRHGNLVVADLVDEDYVMHGRSKSVATLMYGANAFFTKPGQSLAPMFGWLVLQAVGYREHVIGGGEDEAEAEAGAGEYDDEGLSDMQHSMFRMLVLVPLVCAIVQLITWRRFNLRGAYLKQVKIRRKRKEDQNGA